MSQKSNWSLNVPREWGRVVGEELSQGQLSVDALSVDALSVDALSVDALSVDKLSVGELTSCQVLVLKASTGN